MDIPDVSQHEMNKMHYKEFCYTEEQLPNAGAGMVFSL